jgi:segregation and condensation protein B
VTDEATTIDTEAPDTVDTVVTPEAAASETSRPAGEDAGEVRNAVPEGVVDAVAMADIVALVESPPEAPVGEVSAELKAIVEALIFASPDPLTPKVLFKLLADEPKEDVTAAVAALKVDYATRAGLQMVDVAGGYQIVTRPELHEWVRRLFHERSTQKLTVQALETLAVIAYKQPITALEIAEIRGVNTSGVLTTLLERHLIKIVGRKNVVGRPFLYATTKEFLIRFGLNDLNDLPRIEDLAEALGFDPPAGLLEVTPREQQLPIEEP